jgi:23S rRNA pseudouridine1911/1915/1917 synthase
MIVAKNKNTYDELSQQFRNHTIIKTYQAVVEGTVKEDRFTIDAPLGREKKGYRQVVAPKNPRGELRDAITHVRVLQKNTKESLIELTPQTGRTHQLRAHMSHIGYPIVGDRIYGNKDTQETRLFLHAKKIEGTLFGNMFSFEVATPKEFERE